MPRPAQNAHEATTSGALSLDYAQAHAITALSNRPDELLGVIGFGAPRPESLPASCPYIAAPLQPVSGAAYEIWRAASPCRPVTIGRVAGACNAEIAFAAVTLDPSAGETLEPATERAYRDLFDFLAATGFAAPLRFWNYLTDITGDDHGLERYRRFNIGRHLAFEARLRQPLPPAASCVGGRHGASVIYLLAAHQPARTLENTRQVSAYAYPDRYGPRSPSFSRASVHPLAAGQSMFISGTASITGHESRHVGDLHGQTAETIRNLQTLICASGQPASPITGPWTFKIYLHDANDQDFVAHALRSAFGPDIQALYLQADMCRPELLVEIEAFRHTRLSGPAE